MAFVLGTLVFVILAGALDARLPWPRPEREARR